MTEQTAEEGPGISAAIVRPRRAGLDGPAASEGRPALVAVPRRGD